MLTHLNYKVYLKSDKTDAVFTQMKRRTNETLIFFFNSSLSIQYSLTIGRQINKCIRETEILQASGFTYLLTMEL